MGSKKWIAGGLSVLMLLGLWGCEGPAAPERTEGTAPQTQATDGTNAAPRYLTKNTDGDLICIELPSFEGEDAQTLDRVVQDYVQQKLEQITGTVFQLMPSAAKPTAEDPDYSNYWIELEVSQIAAEGSHRSFLFEGILNCKTAAHPADLFFVLNVDIDSCQKIWFRDRYAIDGDLYQTFAKAAYDRFVEDAGGWPEGWGSFEEELCSETAFLDGLRSESGFSWYPVEEGVIVSYPVSFSMGDHMEVLVPLAQSTERSGYEAVLEDLEALLDQRMSDTFKTDWADGTVTEGPALAQALTEDDDLRLKWGYMLWDMTAGAEDVTRSSFGYIIGDMDADAVPELLLLREDRTLLAIFTEVDGTVRLVDAFWPRYEAVLTDAGEKYSITSGGAAFNRYDISALHSGGTWHCKTGFGMEGGSADTGTLYYELVEGEKTTVSEERFDELMEAHPFQWGDSWRERPITFF